MSTPEQEPGAKKKTFEAWRTRRAELADWVMARLVNRDDRCGGYWGEKSEETGEAVIKKTTRPSKGASAGYVTPARLMNHFAPRACNFIVGLHALGADSCGRWLGIDIDAHDFTDEPDRNLRYALALYEKVSALGFRPLLYESDGRGGYHLIVLFEDAVPGPLLFSFGRWLVADHASFGMVTPPETFPKQARLAVPKAGADPAKSGGVWGNWLRVVGRHYRHDHWARVWDGFAWGEGETAVAHILTLTGDGIGLVPPEAYPVDPPARSAPPGGAGTPRTKGGTAGGDGRQPGHVFDDAADFHAMLTEDGGRPIRDRENGASEWVRPGKAEDATSATLGFMKDHRGTPKLFVFTDRWPGLEKGRAYTPFEFVTAKKHGAVNRQTMGLTAKELIQSGVISMPRPPAPIARFGRKQPPKAVTPDKTPAPAQPQAPPMQPVTDLLERVRKHVEGFGPANETDFYDDRVAGLARQLVHGFELPEADGWPLFAAYGATCLPPCPEGRLREVWEKAKADGPGDCGVGYMLRGGHGTLGSSAGGAGGEPPGDDTDGYSQPPDDEGNDAGGSPPMGWSHHVRIADGFLKTYRIVYVKKTAFLYDGRRYQIVSQEYVDAMVWAYLENEAVREHKQWVRMLKPGQGVPELPQLNAHMLGDALRSIKARCHISDDTALDTWIVTSPADGVPDQKPVIAVANGLLDIRTRGLTCHDPQWFSLTAVPAAYDPAAPPPEKFLAVLNELAEPDVVAALQELFGACLDRRLSLKNYVVLLGVKDCGKTAVITALRAFLGGGNYSATSLKLLCKDKFSAFTLFGKLANVVDDENGDDLDDESLLRRFTGGAMVSFEEKHKTPFMALQTAKMISSANLLPKMSDEIDSNWGRLTVYPFDRLIPPEKQNPAMKNEEFWADQLPGMLNWALDGLERVHKRNGRLAECARGEERIEEHRREIDMTRNHLLETYEKAEQDEFLSTEAMYALYVGWCERNGVHELKRITSISLGRRVRDVINKDAKTGTERDGKKVFAVRKGIRLRVMDHAEAALPSVSDHPCKRFGPDDPESPLTDASHYPFTA